jgi:hypothetical protein
MPTTVTLRGISENFDAAEIEALVRTAAEAVRGDGDSDSLSEHQVELADRAYTQIMAERENAKSGPDVDGSETSERFYQALREHADDNGVHVTWTALYARLRSGALRMPERTLLEFLGAYLVYRDYRLVGSPLRGWAITDTRIPADLADGELFSVDGGTTWHVAFQVLTPLQTAFCYANAARDNDALVYRVRTDMETPCLVITQHRT